MASHGDEILTNLYGIVDWSWTGHGTAPATVTVASKFETHPIEFVEEAVLPAIFFNLISWPSVVNYPKLTMETFIINIYVVDDTGENVYPNDAVRVLMDGIITNVLASSEVGSYSLTEKMALAYVEDVRFMFRNPENELTDFLRAFSYDYVCDMARFEIQACGTR